MRKPERGNGLTISLVLLALLAFGGFYLFSDVFQGKVDDAVRRWSEWTPEDIARDPSAFLTSVEDGTRESLAELVRTKTAIDVLEARLQQRALQHDRAIEIGDAALADLKRAYREAEAAQRWPMTSGGREYTRDAARLQIFSLHRELEQRRRQRDLLAGARDQALHQRTNLATAENRCKVQLQQINTHRELLAAGQLADDVRAQLHAMGAIIQDTEVLARAPSVTEPRTLDEIVTAAGDFDAGDFDQIMK